MPQDRRSGAGGAEVWKKIDRRFGTFDRGNSVLWYADCMGGLGGPGSGAEKKVSGAGWKMA